MTYFGTYQRLGMHVSTSNRGVLMAAWRKLSPLGRSRKHREFRHEYFRAILAHHRDAQALYRYLNPNQD
jgi:hypothetical protein